MNYPTPSVGRKVWFYPARTEENQFEHELPHDATVIKVDADEYSVTPFTTVSLFIISPKGETQTLHHVPHSPTPVPYPHFKWMPYQLEQVNTPKVEPACTHTNKAQSIAVAPSTVKQWYEQQDHVPKSCC